MDLLIRHSEIDRKQGKTRQRLFQTLRQRIEDRLKYEDEAYKTVSAQSSTILVRNYSANPENIAELPGVKKACKARKTGSGLESIREAVDTDFNGSFGVRARSKLRSSQEIERRIGSYIQEETGNPVDLESPERWVRIDERSGEAFVYSSSNCFEGPGGLPAGSQGNYAALVSGGTDSSVAAYRGMVRGADVHPVFINLTPFTAEEGLERFKDTVRRLREFNPARNWEATVVEPDTEAFMEIGRGRMVLLRKLMLKTAEMIAEERSLDGVVTGEALNQKSTQTAENLQTLGKPVLRPNIGRNKASIEEEARGLELRQKLSGESACSRLVPGNPATRIEEQELERLEDRIGFASIVEKAFQERIRFKVGEDI